MQTKTSSLTVSLRQIGKSKIARLAAIISAAVAPMLASAQDTITVADPSFEQATYNSGSYSAPVLGWTDSGDNGAAVGINIPGNTFWNNGGNVTGGSVDQKYVAFAENDGVFGQSLSGFQVGQVYWIQTFANASALADTPVLTIYEAASTAGVGALTTNMTIIPVNASGTYTAPFDFLNVPFVAAATSGSMTFSNRSLSGTDGGQATMLYDGVSVIRRSLNDVVICNPSFEASGTGEPSTYINTVASNRMAGWAISGGLAGISQSGGTLANNGAIPDGVNVLGLSSGTAVSQSLFTTNGLYLYVKSGVYSTNTVSVGNGLIVGENYQLSFYVNAESGTAANPLAVATIQGYTAYSNTVTPVGGVNPYTFVTYNFPAWTNTATLIISNATPTGTASTLLVDDVRLVKLPDTIPVANPSFEQGANPTYPYYGVPTGWTGSVGTFGGTTAAENLFWDNGAAVDQSYVCFLQNDGTLSQALSGFQVGQTYWIQCYVNAGNGAWTDTPVVSIACTASASGSNPLTIPTAMTNNNSNIALTNGNTQMIVTPVGGSSPFALINIPFVATATSGTLSFTKVSLSGTDSGEAVLLIDGISVVRRAANEVVVANPSFEASGTGYTYPGYEGPLAGWACPGYGVSGFSIINQQTFAAVEPFFDNGALPDGVNAMCIQNSSPSLCGVTQTLQGLTVGNQYRLTMYLNDRYADYQNGATNAVAQVVIDGNTAFSGNVYPSGVSSSVYPFSRYVNYTFTAAHTNVVLSITNSAPGNSTTLVVDDVDVYSLATAPITVTSSASTVNYGTPVTLTVTITNGPVPGTGLVTFEDGATVLGTAALVNGVATWTGTLPAGSAQTITAVYGGDNTYIAGNNTLPGGQTVNALVVTLGGGRPYNATTTIAGTNLTITDSIDGTNLFLSGSATLASAAAGPETITGATTAATPTLVHSATGNTTTGGSTSFTVTVTAPTIGDTMIAVISTRGTTNGVVSGITETGTTWTRVTQSANATGSTTEIWYAPNVGSNAGTSVAIAQASFRSAAVVMEYGGLLTVNPLDQVANTTGTSTTAATGTTPTTTQASELWLGGIGLVNSSYTLTALANSFTAVASAKTANTTAANNAVVYAVNLVASSTGAAATSGTTTSSAWSGAIATFKAGTVMQLSGSAAGNYTLAGETGSATITAKPLTMSGLSVPASKVYNGTAAAVVSGSPGALAAAEGAGTGTTADGKPYTGDTVSLTGTATGTYNSPLVGVGTTVAYGGVSLTGAQATDYSLTTQANSAATITVLPVTLTGTQVYNATTIASNVNLTISDNHDGANLHLVGNGALTNKAIGVEPLVSFLTPTLVQNTNGSTGASAANTMVLTLGSPPMPGDTLIAVISTRATVTNEVADFFQYGADWSQVRGVANGSGVTTEIWYAANVSTNAGGATVDIDLLGNFLASAVIMEYSGLTATPLDVVASTTGTSVSPVTGSATTTQANELWIGGIGLANSSDTLTSILNGFIAVTNAVSVNGTPANNANVYALQNVVSTLGATSSGGTVASVAWAGALATFKAAPAGALSITGSAAANYTLTGYSGSVTVTAKALVESGLSVPVTMVYDGSAAAALSGTAVLPSAESPGAGSSGDGAPYIGDAVNLTGAPTATYNSQTVGVGTTITYGGLSLTGIQASNYSLTIQSPVSATITAKALTMGGLSVPSSKPYDGTPTAVVSGSPGTLTGSEAVGTGSSSDGEWYIGDTVSLTGTATGTYNDPSVALASTVTYGGVSLTGGQAVDYSLTIQGNDPATITGVGLSITANPVTKTYGTAVSLSPTAFTVGSGLVSPETVTAVVMTATGGTAANAPVTGSPYTITPSAATGANGFVAGNYNIAYNSGALTVNPLTTVLTEAYDGSTNTASPGLSISNVVGGDDVTVTGGGGMASADIGTNAITSSNTLALAGVTAPDYTLSGASVIVTALPVTLTGTRLYDGTAIANEPILSIVTNFDGGNLTLGGASATLAGPSAGVEAITSFLGLSLGGTAATNYTLTQATGSVTVTPLPLILTEEYDGSTNTASPGLSVSNAVNSDDVSVASGSGGMASADVGTNALTSSNTLTLGGVTAPDYTLSEASVIVTPLPVTLAGTRPYDGTAIANESILSIVTNFDGGNLTLGGTSATLAGTGAGVQNITDFTGLSLGGTAATNYTLTGASGAVNITTAGLSITANPVSKVYGTALILDPTAFSVGSGLVSPETVTAVTMTANGGTAANAPVTGSPYAITPSAATGANGFMAANYNIAYNSGALTVTPLTTILTEAYDGTTNTASPGLSIANLVGGDDATVTGSGGMASADIGTNAITSVGSLALAGVTAPDYSLGASVIVTPLPVTLAGTRPYDGTAIALESILSIVSNYDGANLTLGGTSATLASSWVGVQSITDFTGLSLGGSAATNYTMTNATGAVTITNPFNPFSITSSTLDGTGTNLVVCWTSVPGVSYNVLTNTSLAGNGSWVDAGAPISPVVATGTNTCVTIPGVVPTNPGAFVEIKQ